MTVIPNFHGISTGKSIYGILFVIQGHFQGRISRVKNKKYWNFVSISSLTGKCAVQKIKSFCSSALWTCLHHMIILRSQNKITDFLMILAWASPFKSMNNSPKSLIDKINTYYSFKGIVLYVKCFYFDGHSPSCMHIVPNCNQL